MSSLRTVSPSLKADAQQAQSSWGMSDRGAALLAHAAGDEALHGAVLVGDAQRGVAGTRQRAHAVDDDLEHALQAELLRDGHGGSVERFEASPGLLRGSGPLLGFVDGRDELLGAGRALGRVGGGGGSFHRVQSTSVDVTNGPLRVS